MTPNVPSAAARIVLAAALVFAVAGCGQTVSLKLPEVFGSAPKMPEMPKAPEMPKMPEMPKAPEMPKMPELPKLPAIQAAPPPKPVAPAEAVAGGADQLLAGLPAAGAAAGAGAGATAGGTPRPVIVDPLLDGVTGMETAATRRFALGAVEALRAKRSDLQWLPFDAASLQRKPLLLFGTVTPISLSGARALTDGFRICTALADLATGKIVARSSSVVTPEGVDATPTPFFAESPAWLLDAPTEASIRSCEGTNVGDALLPAYVQALPAAAAVQAGIAAHEAGRFADAAAAHRRALALPQGQQLRALNGLYLAQQKAGDSAGAAETFGRIAAFGLERRQLALPLLFRPGSASFTPDAPVATWLDQLARQAVRANGCLDIVGHMTGAADEPANERLSQQRADAVRARLVATAPGLRDRSFAQGVGSRQTMIGFGSDDAKDSLDRRVGLLLRGC